MGFERWNDVEFSYAEVGATAGDLPPGYHHIDTSRVVGHGVADFNRHAATLMSFGVLTSVGIKISSSSPVAAVGTIVEQRLGIGPASLLAPCRVVRVVRESDRVGFAYGSLPPHPESGEEEFMVRLQDDGSVRFSVRSFSRQARWFSKVGAPVVRSIQRRYVDHFLSALR